ncbi:IS21-like element helper ATPase IstB [Gudongella oleilytica]|uniref:IS21-like element helper ATPase IstB n=1 Tax=Gudongella oleilytica TaxID=1582259 RepID=UPI002A3658F1|nr:IS21-like element helper ATPase IstB [Gudongella oleilytica]MDY0257620.1 IS21-like element helper ATPase IstB [Gudongella oleilytica]
MREEISKYQRKLRLSNNLMQIYPKIKAETNEEFLLQLLKELHEDRDEKRRIRNLNNAGFLVVKSLEDYDYSQIRFPDRLLLKDLETLSFLDRKENLILYGSVGTGKTHLSVALGVNAINQGKKAVFYRVHDLVNQLESNDFKTVSKVQKKINSADLLILDEWGYLPLHQEGARLLFDIISTCYETKSIIITTNIEFGRWKGFLFDEKLTAAIVDRLVHHSHMLMFTGKSYRMTNSLIK